MNQTRRWLLVVAVVLACAALAPLLLWTSKRMMVLAEANASPCGAPEQQARVAREWRAAHPLPTASSLPTEVVRAPKPGGAIDGRVLDPEGRPVADVLVRARSEASPPEDAAVARSDASGAFRLNGLGSGAYFLRTWADGFRRATRENVVVGTRELVLTLTPTTRVVGCVVDRATGKPIDRFQVGDEVFEGTGGVYGFTREDGPREHLEVRAAGFVPGFLDATDHGEPERVLHVTDRLWRGIETAGRVLDESGAPLEGAEVSAMSRGERGYRSTTTSAAAGRFRFDDLDDQVWLVTARLAAGERARVGTTAVRLERRREPGEVEVQLGKQGVLVDLLTADLMSEASLAGGAPISPDAAQAIAGSMMEVITERALAGADPDGHDDLLDAAVERLPADAITAEVASAVEALRNARARRSPE